MDKGFGIAALVVAIVAIFVPVYGIHISALAIVLAVIAAFAGDRVFATATPLIAGVNTFYLSPSVWLMLEGTKQSGGQGSFYLVAFAFLAAPFVAMALNSSGTIAINTNKDG